MLVRQRVEFMGRVPLLKRLTEEEREDLASELSVQRFSRGDEIIVQGDGGSTMFIIEEGTATAFVEGVQVPGKPPGEVHRYENPGDFFGELALITNQPRKATVVATSAVLALTLGKEAFERIVGNVGEKMEEARRRLRAASYVKGRRDYKRLFQYYNRSKSGTLDWGEFRALIRKDGRMTAAMMTDRELRTLFCLVDKEGNGCIDQKEFILFLGVAGEDDQEPVEKDEALSPEEMGRRLELLSTVKMLGSLNEKEQRALARALIVQQYAADEDVITAGDAGTEMFIVQEGELEAISPDGTQVWQEYAAGSSFGELALLSDSKRSATVRAVTDCVCLRLRRRTFDSLVGNVGACMVELRRRFKAAAYVTGRLDYQKLFKQYNKTNSGSLDWREFNAAVRKYGHVSTKVATDREVEVLFNMIDLDSNSYISLEEFYLFLGLTKDGQPKEGQEAKQESFSYKLSLDHVEMRLREARQRTYSKHHGRARASYERSMLGNSSCVSDRPNSSGAPPLRSPARPAARTTPAGSPATASGDRWSRQATAAAPQPAGSSRYEDEEEEEEIDPAVRVGDSELIMPLQRLALAEEERVASAMQSHAGEGAIAAGMWGAGRRAMPELAAVQHPAAADHMSVMWGAEQVATAAGGGASAETSAWGSTVRFTPGARVNRTSTAETGWGTREDVGGAAAAPEVTLSAATAAAAKYAEVWGLMSPGMRELAVREESERVGGAAGAFADDVEEGVPPPASPATSTPRRESADGGSGSARRSSSNGGVRASRTSSGGRRSVLDDRLSQRLDRRYANFENSRIEHGHMPE